MPAEMKLGDVLASDCCVPDCSAAPMEDVPFPVCSDHYLKIVRHYHQLTRSSGTVADEFDASLGLGVVAPEPTESVKPYVYFIQYRDRVKIGTTFNLKNRLAAHPFDRILAVIPGSYVVEKDWHRRLAGCRTNGEWFDLPDEMITKIQALGICA